MSDEGIRPSAKDLGLVQPEIGAKQPSLVAELRRIRERADQFADEFANPQQRSKRGGMLDRWGSKLRLKEDSSKKDVKKVHQAVAAVVGDYKEFEKNLQGTDYDPDHLIQTVFTSHNPFGERFTGDFDYDLYRDVRSTLEELIQDTAAHDILKIVTGYRTKQGDSQDRVAAYNLQATIADTIGDRVLASMVFSFGTHSGKLPDIDTKAWPIIKASPLLIEMFGDAIARVEEIAPLEALKVGNREKRAIELLTYLEPTPEVITTVIALSLLGNDQASTILDSLGQRPNWEKLLEAARDANPRLKALLSLRDEVPDLFEVKNKVFLDFVVRNNDLLLQDITALSPQELDTVMDMQKNLFRMFYEHWEEHGATTKEERQESLRVLTEQLSQFLNNSGAENSLLASFKPMSQLLIAFPDSFGEKGRDLNNYFYRDIVRQGEAKTTGEERHNAFRHLNDTITTFLRKIGDEEGELREFVPLLQPGGIFHEHGEMILEYIFKADDFRTRTKEVINLFTKELPDWKQLFLFMDIRLGNELTEAKTDYPISFVPEVEQAGDRAFDFTEDFTFKPRLITEMRISEKRAIADLEEFSDKEVAQFAEFPFSKLTGENKRMVFAYLLSETLRISGSDDAKKEADGRNRQSTRGDLVLNPDMHLQGSAIEYLDGVLQYGNLPSEVLRSHGRDIDAYPFQVDLVKVNRFQKGVITHDIFRQLREQIGERIPRLAKVGQKYYPDMFGGKGVYGMDGQIFYIYSGKTGPFKKDNGDAPDHKLVLGGIPSTETIGVVLRNPRITLDQARENVVENGFYIPIYDSKGKLLFSPEEYDLRVKEFREQETFGRDGLDKLFAGEYTPSKLVSFFARQYRKEYAADAGVRERYTIRLHTNMVLKQYEKYKEYFDPILESAGIPNNFFRVILTLHDIGKYKAALLGDTNMQHNFTTDIVEDALTTLGYTENEKKIAKALLSSDYLGNTLQAQYKMEQNAEGIIQAAAQAGLAPSIFFDLLSAYYRVDAGSYTKDARGKESLDDLFEFDHENKQLRFAPPTQEIITKLRNMVLT